MRGTPERNGPAESNPRVDLGLGTSLVTTGTRPGTDTTHVSGALASGVLGSAEIVRVGNIGPHVASVDDSTGVPIVVLHPSAVLDVSAFPPAPMLLPNAFVPPIFFKVDAKPGDDIWLGKPQNKDDDWNKAHGKGHVVPTYHPPGSGTRETRENDDAWWSWFYKYHVSVTMTVTKDGKPLGDVTVKDCIVEKPEPGGRSGRGPWIDGGKVRSATLKEGDKFKGWNDLHNIRVNVDPEGPKAPTPPAPPGGKTSQDKREDQKRYDREKAQYDRDMDTYKFRKSAYDAAKKADGKKVADDQKYY